MRVYFPANDATVITEKLPTGEFTAIDDATYDGPGSPVGHGTTQLEAIADLVDQLRELDLLEA